MGKIAFVFSGQGAQYPGMGKELAENSVAASTVFAMADEIRPGTSHQCFNGDPEELRQTRNTQPCVFCVDLAAAEALREQGIVPDMVAGFSLGEIAALAFSLKLTPEEAFYFVTERAKAMDLCGQKNPGTMYAVMGLEASGVETICKTVEGCYPVNYNGKLQTVVACTKDVEAKFPGAAEAFGAKTVRLPVSGGFHSPMMSEAKQFLVEEFKNLEIKKGVVPVYSNVTAKPYDRVELLFEQIDSPVLWHPIIEEMSRQGVDVFVEVGPGKTLGNIIKKTLPSATVLSVENKASLLDAVEVLTNARR